MSRYLIIIEETATGYSAYSPDLPGCVAAGKARDSVEREMHDAIEFHLDGLRRAGEPIPAPRSQASYCEWSERAERHGRWVGITTWAECLAVERSGRCRDTSSRLISICSRGR